jgi:hypothetical protein
MLLVTSKRINPALSNVNFTDAKNMTFIRCVLMFASVFPIHSSYAAAQDNADIAYLWQAELRGPTQKCNVPQRVKFVVADAIISGKIQFGKTTYVPNGRLEDSRAIELSLIRFYDDKRPLVTLIANADGTWNGTWTSRKKGCTGKVRVTPR